MKTIVLYPTSIFAMPIILLFKRKKIIKIWMLVAGTG